MIRLLDTARKSFTRLSGACPAPFSCPYEGSYLGRNASTLTRVPERVTGKGSKDEQEIMTRRYRDEYYRFWEISI
eukprot:scaffold69068_cov23-Cyclotella_meneghiniana.AAC.1